MPTPKPQTSPDPLERMSEEGWEAIGAFLRRIANERAEKAAAMASASAAPARQPDSPDSLASESRLRRVKRRR